MRALAGAITLGWLVGCAPRLEPPPVEAAVRMSTDVTGEGRPIVLIGGGLTGWRSWIPHAERLRATRTVVRAQPLNVELGLEDTPLPEEYSVRLESTALAGALDALDLVGPVDLVAWSYGAFVTLDFALEHPGRVRTLTLIEPPAVWVLEATGTADEVALREAADMEALGRDMRDDVSEEQLAAFAHQAGFCAPDEDPRELPSWPVWFAHRRSLRQGPAVFTHHDTADRLRAFDKPVLLFKGTGSAHFLHRIVDGLAATLPRARVVELPGGHAPQIVAMEDFLGAVAAFQEAVP